MTTPAGSITGTTYPSPAYIGTTPNPPAIGYSYVLPTGVKGVPGAADAPSSTSGDGSVIPLSYGSPGNVMDAYKTVLAWIILLSVLYLIGKTRIGYTAIYYAEVLILLFLFATQYQFFREKLSPITAVTQPVSQ